MITVNLTPEEVNLAAKIGVDRVTYSLEHGTKPKGGQPDITMWQEHIEGAIAEAVVAKYMEVPWEGFHNGEFHKGDIGSLEVRSTHYMTSPHLIFKRDDKIGAVYILVKGGLGRYVLVGAIRGHQCKQQKYWDDKKRICKRKPAYAVPDSDLNIDIELIKSSLVNRA